MSTQICRPHHTHLCNRQGFHVIIIANWPWFSIYQFSSVTQSCPTLCNPMNRSTPGLPVHHQHPEFIQTHVHRVSDAIQPPHPLSSPSPPTTNPSHHQSLCQWVNSLHEVAKHWSFSFSIIPSKEIPGLISFRMDWLDLLAVQGTLKSLLQHYSSKASINHIILYLSFSVWLHSVWQSLDLSMLLWIAFGSL